MKKRLIILLILSSLILTGFTVIDSNYYTYREPDWVWREQTGSAVYRAYEIKDKILVAEKELEKKGLKMEDVKIYVSPRSYGVVKGMAWKNEIVIANNSYDTIYHELGHMYDHKHKGLIEKYAKDMKKYYPYVKIEDPTFEPWERKITEDFAEEFRMLFTDREKRTLYPPFPNFYEWLLRNTQPIEITRQEVFDKLGGTQELINRGIVIGNTLGDYMLDKPIKRSELATVLVRLGKGHRKGIAPFTDIKGKWYEDYVNQIYSTSLIKGYPDGSFKGERFVTRYELHMILDRIK